jgi:hypothetical protein
MIAVTFFYLKAGSSHLSPVYARRRFRREVRGEAGAKGREPMYIDRLPMNPDPIPASRR